MIIDSSNLGNLSYSQKLREPSPTASAFDYEALNQDKRSSPVGPVHCQGSTVISMFTIVIVTVILLLECPEGLRPC